MHEVYADLLQLHVGEQVVTDCLCGFLCYLVRLILLRAGLLLLGNCAHYDLTD